MPRAFAARGIRVGTDANFAAAVLNSNRPSMVTFSAPWCGPCKRLAPILDQISDDYAGRLTVVKVDIDDNPGVVTQYGIRSAPTTLIFSGGVVVEQSVGLTTSSKLIELFARYL